MRRQFYTRVCVCGTLNVVTFSWVNKYYIKKRTYIIMFFILLILFFILFNCLIIIIHFTVFYAFLYLFQNNN